MCTNVLQFWRPAPSEGLKKKKKNTSSGTKPQEAGIARCMYSYQMQDTEKEQRLAIWHLLNFPEAFDQPFWPQEEKKWQLLSFYIVRLTLCNWTAPTAEERDSKKTGLSDSSFPQSFIAFINEAVKALHRNILTFLAQWKMSAVKCIYAAKPILAFAVH